MVIAAGVLGILLVIPLFVSLSVMLSGGMTKVQDWLLFYLEAVLFALCVGVIFDGLRW